MSDNKFTLPIMSTYSQTGCFSTISCGFLNLVLTVRPIRLPSGYSDLHDFYEFLIPFTPILKFYVDNRELDCHPSQILPINPGQRHGVRTGHDGISYILITVSHNTMTRQIRRFGSGVMTCRFPVDLFPVHPDIQHVISRLIQESKVGDCGREIIMQCLAEELSVLLIRHYYRQPSHAGMVPLDSLVGEQARFRDVIALMQNNFSDRLSIEDLAKLCEMNCFHFIRTFKRFFNISPYNFLTRIRIFNARQMLIHTQLTASEIGRLCGFLSASRFSAVFRKDTGMTPSRYRKENMAD